jgi:glutathione synthase
MNIYIKNVRDGRLFLSIESGSVETEHEVSLVYFRAGYTPKDYPSDNEWEGRRLLEGAFKCVKCPSLGYQLAGAKIVQQRLCEDGQVEKFLLQSHHKDKREVEADVNAVRSCFTEMYSLHRKSASESYSMKVGGAIMDAIDRPYSWVMKPQREGGGNNIFGSDVRNKLRDGGDDELSTLVLMSRIKPTSQPAVLVSNERPLLTDAVCELGVFGVFLAANLDNDDDEGVLVARREIQNLVGNQKDPLVIAKSSSEAITVPPPPLINSNAGHLVRTKSVRVDEGGVASGYAVLSSPLLI